MQVNIFEVQPNSPEYNAVVVLADKYRSSLGFLPRGAYEEYAKRRTILAAQLSEDSTIVGYLLYRETPRFSRISIAHFCVDEPYRGHGIARQLFEHLCNIVVGWTEITLLCRRDYELDKFWERLGFQYSGEKSGRGTKQAILSNYRYPLQRDLFVIPRESALTGAGNRIKVVIDSNVFYHLLEANGGHPLQADWLLEDVDLYVTPELNGEIYRSDNPKQRQQGLDFVRTFPVIASRRTDQAYFDQLYQLLKDRLASQNLTPQDESDLRHLVYSVDGNADYFVTQDEGIRQKLGEDIQRHYGLTILRPEELIIRIDEYTNRTNYGTESLAGSSVRVRQIKSDEVDPMIRRFHRVVGEKQSHFREKLSIFLNHPSKYQVMIIAAHEDQTWGVLIIDRSFPHRLDIPLFLLIDPARMAALASHLLTWLTEVAANEHRNFVCLQDVYTRIDVDALTSAGYQRFGQSWCKVCAKSVFTTGELEAFLMDLKGRHSEETVLLDGILDKLTSANNAKDSYLLLHVERLLWPLKISEVEAPCYIVPIRPHWAMDLFDTNLGKETLYGSDPSRVFRMDNVYYRSSAQKLPTAPSRILWYVSRDPYRQHGGLSAVRACAYVDEVQIGNPKVIFGRFRKLGVYSWVDLIRHTKGNLNESLLAFQFSRTELLKRPVSLDSLKRILDRKSAPQAPFKISADQFLKIYALGQ
jgi:GNAT superfamily N-acetyltransferase/predicted nucleic acid-binding protein